MIAYCLFCKSFENVKKQKFYIYTTEFFITEMRWLHKNVYVSWILLIQISISKTSKIRNELFLKILRKLWDWCYKIDWGILN